MPASCGNLESVGTANLLMERIKEIARCKSAGFLLLELALGPLVISRLAALASFTGAVGPLYPRPKEPCARLLWNPARQGGADSPGAPTIDPIGPQGPLGDQAALRIAAPPWTPIAVKLRILPHLNPPQTGRTLKPLTVWGGVGEG